MESENGATQSIIEDLHSSDIQGDQMEGESRVTRSIIDELHSSDIQGDNPPFDLHGYPKNDVHQ